MAIVPAPLRSPGKRRGEERRGEERRREERWLLAACVSLKGSELAGRRRGYHTLFSERVPLSQHQPVYSFIETEL